MPFFTPDFVAPGDRIGFGWWLSAHNLEHDQFYRLGLVATPRANIPSYDLSGWDWNNQEAQQDWLDAHQASHIALRQQTGVQGYDLATVDLSRPEDFVLWMDTHAFEHSQIRRVLGIV